MISNLLVILAVFSQAVAWLGMALWGFSIEVFLFGMFLASVLMTGAVITALADLLRKKRGYNE